MNISFTKKQEKYIKDQVESGDFQNASELVRDAIRMHQIYREKMLADLRREIEKAWNGPDSERTVMDILADKKEKYGREK